MGEKLHLYAGSAVFGGLACPVEFGYQSTAQPWPEVKPKPRPKLRCGACSRPIGEQDERDTCQVCGQPYHRRGCGISTLYSFTCNRCRRERRMPSGYRRPE